MWVGRVLTGGDAVCGQVVWLGSLPEEGWTVFGEHQGGDRSEPEHDEQVVDSQAKPLVKVLCRLVGRNRLLSRRLTWVSDANTKVVDTVTNRHQGHSAPPMTKVDSKNSQ